MGVVSGRICALLGLIAAMVTNGNSLQVTLEEVANDESGFGILPIEGPRRPQGADRSPLLEVPDDVKAMAEEFDRSRRGSARVIGGQKVDEEDFEKFGFMAALLFEGQQFCGGSLIAPTWVLTAGHCVEDGFLTEVLVSRFDLQDPNEPNSVSRNPIRAILHPKYNWFTLDNDIALIELENPIISVAPVSLTEAAKFEDAGTKLQVMGFGAVSYPTDEEYFYEGERAEYPSELQRVEVPVVSKQQCTGPGSYFNSEITSSMICAGYEEGGQDSCIGDSGGPLFHEETDGRVVQVGIVSWGEGCAFPNFYGVYTRVSKFLLWIDEITGALPLARFQCFRNVGQGVCRPQTGKSICSSEQSCMKSGSCTEDICRKACREDGDCMGFDFAGENQCVLHRGEINPLETRVIGDEVTLIKCSVLSQCSREFEILESKSRKRGKCRSAVSKNSSDIRKVCSGRSKCTRSECQVLCLDSEGCLGVETTQHPTKKAVCKHFFTKQKNPNRRRKGFDCLELVSSQEEDS